MIKKPYPKSTKTLAVCIMLVCLIAFPTLTNAQNFSIGPGWNIYGVETTPPTIENPPNDGNNQTPAPSTTTTPAPTQETTPQPLMEPFKLSNPLLIIIITAAISAIIVVAYYAKDSGSTKVRHNPAKTKSMRKMK